MPIRGELDLHQDEALWLLNALMVEGRPFSVMPTADANVRVEWSQAQEEPKPPNWWLNVPLVVASGPDENDVAVAFSYNDDDEGGGLILDADVRPGTDGESVAYGEGQFHLTRDETGRAVLVVADRGPAHAFARVAIDDAYGAVVIVDGVLTEARTGHSLCEDGETAFVFSVPGADPLLN